MSIPLLDVPERHWVCPNCDQTSVTKRADVHTQFHHCPKLGFTAPMVEDGVRVGVRAVEREDYIGHEDVQCSDDGRPIMAVVTTRDDGEDRAVYAPCASVTERK